MPAYSLRGIEVQFPYEAYQCQVHTSPSHHTPFFNMISADSLPVCVAVSVT